jgi:glutaredoxin
MQPSGRLLQHTARITLFTRQHCSLCDDAKSVLTHLGKKRSFDFYEIDVMHPSQNQWKLAYEFDAPVVSRPDSKM